MKSPTTFSELKQRAEAIAGLALSDIATQLDCQLETDFNHHKGWVGHLLERILGADAASNMEPDFTQLSIELKTLPLNKQHQPKESTFVCAVPKRMETHWQASCVYRKLAHVLWFPIEADANIPIPQRRLGMPLFWQPNFEEEVQLRQDWQELTEYLMLGQADRLTAKHGQVLQVRPKAAHSRVLNQTIDAQGEVGFIVPRGFYLRTAFTATVLKRGYLHC